VTVPRVRREADEERVPPVALARELADVELSRVSELSRARIADVRVVGPDGDLRGAVRPVEVSDEGIERLGHVAVAQIPALGAGAEDGAVVLLRVHNEARVLLRVEEPVLVEPAVATRLLRCDVPKFHELLDHLLLAWLRSADPCLVRIHLGIGAEVVETGIAIARAPRRLRIDLVEVGHHRFHRGVEAVEVEAVEADLRSLGWECVVPLAEPGDELDDVRVQPHPRGKAPEIGERFLRSPVPARAANVQVNAVRVWPVPLHRHDREALLGD